VGQEKEELPSWEPRDSDKDNKPRTAEEEQKARDNWLNDPGYKYLMAMCKCFYHSYLLHTKKFAFL